VTHFSPTSRVPYAAGTCRSRRRRERRGQVVWFGVLGTLCGRARFAPPGPQTAVLRPAGRFLKRTWVLAARWPFFVVTMLAKRNGLSRQEPEGVEESRIQGVTWRIRAAQNPGAEMRTRNGPYIDSAARPRRPQANRMEPPMNADGRRYGSEPKKPIGVYRQRDPSRMARPRTGLPGTRGTSLEPGPVGRNDSSRESRHDTSPGAGSLCRCDSSSLTGSGTKSGTGSLTRCETRSDSRARSRCESGSGPVNLTGS